MAPILHSSTTASVPALTRQSQKRLRESEQWIPLAAPASPPGNRKASNRLPEGSNFLLWVFSDGSLLENWVSDDPILYDSAQHIGVVEESKGELNQRNRPPPYLDISQFLIPPFRKMMPRTRTDQVRVKSENRLEGPYHEYSWRKYEQKDILGAKYPRLFTWGRSYYRCTYRNTQNC